MTPLVLLKKTFDAWYWGVEKTWCYTPKAGKWFCLFLVGMTYREVIHDTQEFYRLGNLYKERIEYHLASLDIEKPISLIIAERDAKMIGDGPQSTETMIEQAAYDYKIPAALIRQTWNQESGGLGMAATRHEPHKVRYAMSFVKDKPTWAQPRQAEMVASSHCAMQIMGYNSESGMCADEGVTEWWHVYDKEKCIRCGAKILSKGYHTRGNQAKAALAYNGGGNKNYPALVFAQSGDRVKE